MNICNGDKINVKLKINDEAIDTFEKKYSIKFTNTEQDIEVTGIKEPKKIKLPDGFERCIRFKNDNSHGQIDVDIPDDFEVKSGDVTLRSNLLYRNIISVIKDGQELAYFYFVCDKDNIKVGDIVEVIPMSNKAIPYRLEPDIIKVKMTDIGAYIDNYEKISDEYIKQLDK